MRVQIRQEGCSANCQGTFRGRRIQSSGQRGNSRCTTVPYVVWIIPLDAASSELRSVRLLPHRHRGKRTTVVLRFD